MNIITPHLRNKPNRAGDQPPTDEKRVNIILTKFYRHGRDFMYTWSLSQLDNFALGTDPF